MILIRIMSKSWVILASKILTRFLTIIMSESRQESCCLIRASKLLTIFFWWMLSESWVILANHDIDKILEEHLVRNLVNFYKHYTNKVLLTRFWKWILSETCVILARKTRNKVCQTKFLRRYISDTCWFLQPRFRVTKFTEVSDIILLKDVVRQTLLVRILDSNILQEVLKCLTWFFSRILSDRPC